MNASLSFSRDFARLVWLLAHEPENIADQKAALRSVVAASKDRAVTLAIRERRLEVNGERVPESPTGAQEAAPPLAAHGVREMRADAGAAAADLLGAARILAAPPTGERLGEAAQRQLEAIGARTVHFTLAEPAPPAGVPAARVRDAVAAGTSHDSLRIVTDEDGGMFRHFAAPQAPRGSVEELLARLAPGTSPEGVTVALDDLVVMAENAARDDRPALIAEVLYGLTAREGSVTHPESRRAYALALRRLARPALLRKVAALLPAHRDRTADYVAVIVRAGEDGADAVIEQLTQAQSIGERRVFFDVLRGLQAGVPTLVHMLGDARWFVVRNAAELLGEMQAAEAEEPLTALLGHAHDRVRHSAARALLQLGTSSASRAVHEAMRDASPEVRAQLAGEIATRPDARTAITLTRALDDEADTEVQLALIEALGRVGTSQAVRRLADVAAPEGRLFRRKPAALRIAAVQALGEARTREAIAVLRELENDRDRAVREAVARALGGATAR